MTPRQKVIPELEELLAKRKRRYVRTKEGADIYGMSITAFRRLTKEAKARIVLKHVSLVDMEKLDKYIEQMKEE